MVARKVRGLWPMGGPGDLMGPFSCTRKQSASWLARHQGNPGLVGATRRGQLEYGVGMLARLRGLWFPAQQRSPPEQLLHLEAQAFAYPVAGRWWHRENIDDPGFIQRNHGALRVYSRGTRYGKDCCMR